MKYCPCCQQEMKEKSYFYQEVDFSGESDDVYYKATKYRCAPCKISCDENGNWKIPKELQPTEKQLNTVSFIKSVLPETGSSEILTKREAWKFIHDYFEEAKKEKQEQKESYYEEEDDFYGLDYGDFC